MYCIKCGEPVAEGELFCRACSLNQAKVKADDGMVVHIPQAKGRMQTPQRQQRTPQPAVQQEEKRGGRGLKYALLLVTILLAAMVAFVIWQYGDFQMQKASLVSWEAELDDRERELEELQERIETLETTKSELEAKIADRELKIAELEKQLSGSQSNQSQTQYDLTVKQAELDRLKKENESLSAQTDDLEEEIKALLDTQKELLDTQDKLTTALEGAETYRKKAQFMDSYVVFVENNNTGYYHTYDCEAFVRKSFWAYSRKLAESSGFKPCPECGGTP